RLVTVADAKNAFGVDAANNVYQYISSDGTNWTQMPISGKKMKQVSMASDGTVCGLDPNGAVWQYSIANATWTRMAAGSVAFRYISCGSANNIGAMGTDNLCYQNTGSGWTQMAAVPGPLGVRTLVSVASDRTVVASDANGLLYQCNAASSNWQLIDGGWGFIQFSCGSATNLWGVDGDGKFFKYTGGPGSNRTQVVPGIAGKQVSVASDGTTVWSIGTDNLVYRLVNNTWTKLTNAVPVSPRLVTVADAKNAFGVDAANNVYQYISSDGTNWTQMPISGQQMKQVSMASDGTVCGLDPNGAVWQYSIANATWTRMAAGSVAFRYISCGSANNLGAMGTDNLCYQNTGSGWTQMAAVPGPSAGTQVSVASDGTVVVSDYNGLLYQCNAASSNWQLIDGGWGFKSFSCGSATNLWGVDGDGKFFKYTGGPGSNRTQVVPGIAGKQVSVASDGTTVWSIGTDNLVYRLVNNTWTKLTNAVPVSPRLVTVADAKNAFGVDAANNVYQYISSDGTNWTQMPISGQQMKQVSMASDG